VAAGRVLDARWARRDEWLLLTTDELSVLAHLPGDPARYGFATAALHRPHPVQARRVTPERATRTAAGWRRTAWSNPSEAVFTDVAHPGPCGASGNDPYGRDNDIYDNDYDASHDDDDGWPYTEAA
jgi:hypothetical protein